MIKFKLGQMHEIVAVPSTLNSIKFMKRLNKTVRDGVLPVKEIWRFKTFSTALSNSLGNEVPSLVKGDSKILFRLAKVESGVAKYGDGSIEESIKTFVRDKISFILKDIPLGRYQESVSPHGVISMMTREERFDSLLLGSYVGLLLNQASKQKVVVCNKAALWSLSEEVKQELDLGSASDNFVIQYFECFNVTRNNSNHTVIMYGLTYYIYFNPKLGIVARTSGDDVKFIELDRVRDLPAHDDYATYIEDEDFELSNREQEDDFEIE